MGLENPTLEASYGSSSPGQVGTCTTCQSEVLSLAGPNVIPVLWCAGKLDLCSSRHSERDQEVAMWDFCEPVRGQPGWECADSVLPWKSQGRAAGRRGLLLGSLGCKPAHRLLSSAGCHCREPCLRLWLIPVWLYWLCWCSLGCPWVLCPSSVPQLPPQGTPGGAVLHSGPGSRLHLLKPTQTWLPTK